jgi:branched-chain amino acid transport system permease protein
VALAVATVALNVPWTQASQGLFLPFLPLEATAAKGVFYETMLVLAIIAVVILRWISSSKLGAGLIAIREDEDVARTICINATALKMQAFLISAFLTGMVGGIYSYYRTYVHPTIVFDTNISILVVLMALFGGSR